MDNQEACKAVTLEEGVWLQTKAIKESIATIMGDDLKFKLGQEVKVLESSLAMIMDYDTLPPKFKLAYQINYIENEFGNSTGSSEEPVLRDILATLRGLQP